ncbi:C4-dicarboxylate ABC transporter substrate-binding protein [Vulcanibacillus modesticaldus]|uniref:C4-dicarboxylate ABC transporter substrate-binding protein n=1 Tax=Vulcanibacillus modesticaldus TaxID=337097 RepID=A0A1D2YTM9_9BACI|nr:TAXI family TRAP transporter solute-binding subunit [Vulcanibacillus modesticaldus]OEF99054.1 C4-dicarboxylate ABC transporter substrate-binding protein [Vulcanibacillus modesticaldus]
MKKKMFLLALALVTVFALAACSTGNEEGEKAPSQLIIATGGTSGTYYPLGGGIAQIITDNTNVSATAQSTGASVENMRLLQNKEVDLAFTQTDIADYANNGKLMFESGKVDNLQGIASLYYETVQLVVPANSDIKSVADLKGKRVSVGAPGSGVEANARQILEIYGLTFDDLKAEYLSFGDSSSKIKDGNLDAAFVTAGAPTSAVTELSATKGVKLVSLDSDKIAELVSKYPFYVKQTIPANTYSGLDKDVDTVAVKAMLVVRKGLPEDLVYDITKSIFENTDKLVTINAKAKNISLDNALEGMSLEIHPGALKYYQEKGLK